MQRSGSGQDRASRQLLDSFNGQTCGKQGTWVFKYIPSTTTTQHLGTSGSLGSGPLIQKARPWHRIERLGGSGRRGGKHDYCQAHHVLMWQQRDDIELLLSLTASLRASFPFHPAEYSFISPTFHSIITLLHPIPFHTRTDTVTSLHCEMEWHQRESQRLFMHV